MAFDVRDIKVFAVLWILEIDQGWEQQDHVPPLVHDGCTTVGAADFAGQLMHGSLLRALVPSEVVDAVSEVNVFFVEDGGPLEWCP